MPEHRAALIRDGWIDMVIVLVDDHFDRLPPHEQDQAHRMIARAAAEAGLKAETVLAWKGERDQLKHRGPARWRSFMESVTLASVERRLTHTVSW